MVPRKPNVKCWQREASKSKQAQTSMVERFWQTEFPGSPGMRICITRRAWYLFLRKHDVIKIGQKQKGNVLRVV